MSGAAICAAASGGYLDTQVVTSGLSGTAGFADRQVGRFGAKGSINDGTSNIYGGAAFVALDWSENGAGGNDFIEMIISGTLANSGWTNINIQGTILTRATATFLQSGGNTSWSWNTLGLSFGAQPFGGSGSVIPVSFT